MTESRAYIGIFLLFNLCGEPLLLWHLIKINNYWKTHFKVKIPIRLRISITKIRKSVVYSNAIVQMFLISL